MTDEADKGTPLLAINRRLPRGENLPHYAVEYFNQLVAQYLTLPVTEGNAREASARTLAEDLIREQGQEKAEQERRGIRWPWEQKKHYLNWGDVSGMEMAVLQLLPEAYLQRYAWNLRARYHEVAGQCWYDFYQHSTPPDGTAPSKTAPSKEGGMGPASVTYIPLGASGCFLLTPAAPEHPAGVRPGDSPAAAGLRADLSILLSDLQRLRSTIKAREEKRSRISLIGALLALAALTVALGVYAAPAPFAQWADRHPDAARDAAIAVFTASPIPTASPPGKPAAPASRTPARPVVASAKPTIATPPPSVADPATTSSASQTLHLETLRYIQALRIIQILRISALVILCGILGGLISMLRRLQSLPPGTTPLFDTIVLDAGEFGIGLAPIYGGIFAMVLYLVFLSGVLNTVITSTAGDTVFPRFNGAAATPATTADTAKMLVWAFIAGFAEQLVPDVLNRLTTRNTAALAKLSGAPGAVPPSRPV